MNLRELGFKLSPSDEWEKAIHRHEYVSPEVAPFETIFVRCGVDPDFTSIPDA